MHISLDCKHVCSIVIIIVCVVLSQFTLSDVSLYSVYFNIKIYLNNVRRG